jgi:hypothetical protein
MVVGAVVEAVVVVIILIMFPVIAVVVAVVGQVQLILQQLLLVVVHISYRLVLVDRRVDSMPAVVQQVLAMWVVWPVWLRPRVVGDILVELVVLVNPAVNPVSPVVQA